VLSIGLYSEAEHLAIALCPEHLPEIHLRHAMSLEDQESFEEASQAFIKAGKGPFYKTLSLKRYVGKPQEAIEMFIHCQDWTRALAIAEKYIPTSVVEIYSLEAQSLAEKEDYHAAEELFLKARVPTSAVEMYLSTGSNDDDALRVAEMYVPSKLQDVHLHIANRMETKPIPQTSDLSGLERNHAVLQVMKKAESLEKGCDFQDAMELYLSIDTDTIKDHAVLQKVNLSC